MGYKGKLTTELTNLRNAMHIEVGGGNWFQLAVSIGKMYQTVDQLNLFNYINEETYAEIIALIKELEKDAENKNKRDCHDTFWRLNATLIEFGVPAIIDQ